MSSLTVGKIVVNGKVRLPSYTTASLPTASNNTGLLVYNSTTGNIDFSNGTSWTSAATTSFADGLSPERAANSAAALKAAFPSSPSGVYWIKINNCPTAVYCEMGLDQGGWMCAMNIDTSDGHQVFYNNLAFWEQAHQRSDWPGRGMVIDPYRAHIADFKAIAGGNLWKNFSATQMLIIVHNRDFNNYFGWRSWNLNTGTVTKIGQFWSNGQPNICSNPSGGQNHVKYKYRITNGTNNSAQSGPAGSLWSKTPNSFEAQDLIVNATHYNVDSNRLTQCGSGAPSVDGDGNYYSRTDNQGAGFGAYYDTTYGGRPESDAQSWDSSTWSGAGGRFGNDTLQDSFENNKNNCNAGGGWTYHRMWGGKPCTGGGGDTYNWNGYSGYNYSFGLFLK